MKPHAIIFTAAIFTLAACDGEKVQEAKKESAEAAKAAGEASKEVGGKILDKTKEGLKAAGEKLKAAKEAIGEKGGPALESFKAKMGGFSDLIKGMKGQADDDPAKAKAMMDTAMAKLKGISAEGVPADLKIAFQNYQRAMGRILEFAKQVPTDAAAANQWQVDHAQELHQLEKDSTAALKALKETAAKHGLTGLDLGE